MPRPLRGGSGRPQPACSAASSRTALARGDLSSRVAIFERVLLRGRSELVDETLDHEDVVCGPDAAPERSGNSRRLLADILDPHVGKRVGRLGRAVHGIDIEASHHGDEVVEAGCAYHPERLGEQLTGHPRHDRGGRYTVKSRRSVGRVRPGQRESGHSSTADTYRVDVLFASPPPSPDWRPALRYPPPGR